MLLPETSTYMTDIKGKTALITGASSGIGEAAARLLAQHGVNIVACARRKDRLDALIDEIESAGGSGIAVRCDVSDRAQVDEAASRAKEAFGAIDILFNNAGIMPLAPLSKGRVDDWDRMIDVNLKGLLYAINAVLPTMLEQNAGHIINTSSVAGRVVFPVGTVYCATKHAVHAISEGLRAELSQMDPPMTGIRVTVIAPGVVRTELPDSITDAQTREQIKQYFSSMDKPLASEDIASAVLFAVQSPAHMDVNEILIRPVTQAR